MKESFSNFTHNAMQIVVVLVVLSSRIVSPIKVNVLFIAHPKRAVKLRHCACEEPPLKKYLISVARKTAFFFSQEYY